MLPLGASIDIVPGIAPLDLQTARTGDYVSLKDAEGVLIVIFKGAGTAADDPLFTLSQATTVAGGGAKAAAVIDTIYKKQAADLTALGVWSKVTQAPATTFQADGTSAEEQAVYAIAVPAARLDVDNGFDCVSLSCADTGLNAQLGCVLYILYGLRNQDHPANLASRIVD